MASLVFGIILLISGIMMIKFGFGFCIDGLSENADYGRQFESVFRHGNANPGNDAIGAGIFFIVIGIVFLIIGIVLIDKRKKTEHNIWLCMKCGNRNTGMFCSLCGPQQMPMQNNSYYGNQMGGNGQFSTPSWLCECGKTNQGAFCGKCGKPKPVAIQKETVLVQEDSPKKFCSSCGKPLGDGIFCQYCGTKQ